MPVFTPLERVGSLIDGKYALHRILARGGMGVVFEATHARTERRVAVKLLKPELTDTADHVRFSLEARATTRLEHPNVVQVLDMGSTEDGAPYLVMELLTGRTLKDELTARGRLPPVEALALLLPLLGAVATAHDRGILHRDLKPANVFLSVDGAGRIIPKLLDFGLARDIQQTGLTNSGAILGTPNYLSPEQAEGGDELGPASDIWSLGATLFECLSGKPPFSGSHPSIVIHKLLHEPPPALHSRAPDLPSGLAAAVDRALRRDPAARYADARSFAQALLLTANDAGIELPDEPDAAGLPEWQRWLAEAHTSVDTTAEAHVQPESSDAAPSAPALPTRSPDARRYLVYLLIFAALGIAGVLLAIRSQRTEPRAAGPAPTQPVTERAAHEAGTALPSPPQAVPSTPPPPPQAVETAAPAVVYAPPDAVLPSASQPAARKTAARQPAARQPAARQPATRKPTHNPQAADRLITEW